MVQYAFFFLDRFTTLRIFLFGQIGSVDLNPLKEYFFLFIKLIECCLFCLTILKGVLIYLSYIKIRSSPVS